MPKMFLIHGRSRSELAGALAEYRTFCRTHPDDELAVVLDGVSRDIRAALKEKRAREPKVRSGYPCRGCGDVFPYDPDADYCGECAAVNAGEEVAAVRER